MPAEPSLPGDAKLPVKVEMAANPDGGWIVTTWFPNVEDRSKASGYSEAYEMLHHAISDLIGNAALIPDGRAAYEQKEAHDGTTAQDA